MEFFWIIALLLHAKAARAIVSATLHSCWLAEGTFETFKVISLTLLK